MKVVVVEVENRDIDEVINILKNMDFDCVDIVTIPNDDREDIILMPLKSTNINRSVKLINKSDHQPWKKKWKR